MYIKQDIGTGQVFKHSAKTAGILQAEWNNGHIHI